MGVGLVGADDEVGHGLHGPVAHDADLLQSHRPNESDRRTREAGNQLGFQQLNLRHTQEAFDLDLIHIMIAADQDGDRLFARAIEQRLDQLSWLNFQEGSDFLHSSSVRG